MNKLLGFLATGALVAVSASAQTSTTLTNAINDKTINVVLGSLTNVLPPGVYNGTVGTPSGGPNETVLYIDGELLRVNAINSSLLMANVERGAFGTLAVPHGAGATVYVGGSDLFPPFFSDGYAFVAPGSCVMTATTTAFTSGPGLVRAAAGNFVLSATANTTAGTVTVDCTVSGATTKYASIKDVTLLYGVQTTALASIAAPILDSVTYPITGGAAAGTVGTSAGGTLTVTPGTLQTSTTTTGQCYNEKIVLGTPYAVGNPAAGTANNFLQNLNVEQVFTLAGTSATTLQVCGVLVHYTTTPTSR